MPEKESDGPLLTGYEALAPYPDVYAFSTTRHGGVSRGNYSTLNCTPYTGDDPVCVRLNQERLLATLPFHPCELVIPRQTHDIRPLVIDDRYLQAGETERQEMLQGIDALLTDVPGYCLCISTADCIPLLLYDRTHHAVAAIHAGWRGTVARITQATLRTMHDRYGTCGTDLIACIGPGISLDAFKVGDEVYEAFREAGFPMPYVAAWRPETHKWHIDLWEANRYQLLDFGIPGEQIETAGICTYTRHETFFSARRLGIHSGRILSGILLAPSATAAPLSPKATASKYR